MEPNSIELKRERFDFSVEGKKVGEKSFSCGDGAGVVFSNDSFQTVWLFESYI